MSAVRQMSVATVSSVCVILIASLSVADARDMVNSKAKKPHGR